MKTSYHFLPGQTSISAKKYKFLSKKGIFVVDPSFFPIFRSRRQIQTRYDLLLFNAITDAEEALSQLRESLMAAQRQAEELFMDEKEADPS